MSTFLKSICVVLLLLFAAKIQAQQTSVYIKTTINDLLAQQKHTGKKDITFLSENTLTGKLLTINQNENLNNVFRYDMVYYVIDGAGKLKTGNAVTPLKTGSIVFVPRNSPYSFYDVEAPLHIYALLSLGSMGDHGKNNNITQSFTLPQIETQRSSGNNVWNSFLKRNSMIFGLYMLPKPLHGDSALTHKWDEINLITKGTGKFQVGKKLMDVKPGDIIYVKKGNPHYFHFLKQDLDILIFFEMKSMEGE